MTSWTDVLELSIDAYTAVPAGTMRWGQGKWGTGKWGGAAGDWQTIGYEELLSASFGATRSTLADNLGTGTLSLTVRNADGWASGRARPGQLTLLPGVPMRVRARITAGTWRNIWCGMVDALSTAFEPDGAHLATIHAVDAMAALALVDPPDTAAPAELLGARLARMGTMAQRSNLTFFSPDLSGGQLAAGNVAQQLVTEATLAVNSFGGVIGASPSVPTQITYSDSGMTYVPFTVATAPLQISNRGTTNGAIGICPLTITVDGPAVDNVANRVQLARAGGTMITREAPGSQATYGLRTWGRQDLLCANQADVDALAARHLQYRAAPRPLYNVTYDVPHSIYRGSLDEWLRWAIHPLAPSEQNIVRAAVIPVGIDWITGTDDPWTISAVASGVSVSHAITPSSWTVTMAIDTPGSAPVPLATEEEVAA